MHSARPELALKRSPFPAPAALFEGKAQDGRIFPASKQRGAVLLLVTFSLLVFFGLAALVLDLGRLYIIKSQLQNAADAGALRGALALNGTGSGVANAKSKAEEGALTNQFLLASSALDSGDLTVEVSTKPSGQPWVLASTVNATAPNDYYFIRVTAEKSGIGNLFAGIIEGGAQAARALAVAGRFPQGKVMPFFIPIIRRNKPEQINGIGSGHSDCDGKVFSTQDYKKPDCPDPAQTPVGQWRGPDLTGKWGFLKPGETKCSKEIATCPEPSGQDAFESSSVAFTDTHGNPVLTTQVETGGYYIIRLDPSEEVSWSTTGTSWTGNFGYFLSEPPLTTQKSIQDAVCRGEVRIPSNPIPGCRDLHTGGLSVPRFVEALNTRFDRFDGAFTDFAACPPDANIYPWSGTPPATYPQYQAGSPSTPPSHSGAEGRRVIRVYVIDNAWLNGYSDGSSTCPDPLQGGSRLGHIVGCADFFMWKPADTKDNGLAYVEFIDRVPDNECTRGSGPAGFINVRLFR